MIRGIHHFALRARDFDRMLKFYEDAFGFASTGIELQWTENALIDSFVGLRDSAGRMAILKAGTCFLELFEYSSPPGRPGEPLRLQDFGYTHFGVIVADIASEYERLKALGMTFDSPKPIDMGDGKAVFGRDPEGNMVEIIEPSARNVAILLEALDGTPTRP